MARESLKHLLSGPVWKNLCPALRTLLSVILKQCFLPGLWPLGGWRLLQGPRSPPPDPAASEPGVRLLGG